MSETDEQKVAKAVATIVKGFAWRAIQELPPVQPIDYPDKNFQVWDIRRLSTLPEGATVAADPLTEGPRRFDPETAKLVALMDTVHKDLCSSFGRTLAMINVPESIKDRVFQSVNECLINFNCNRSRFLEALVNFAELAKPTLDRRSGTQSRRVENPDEVPSESRHKELSADPFQNGVERVQQEWVCPANTTPTQTGVSLIEIEIDGGDFISMDSFRVERRREGETFLTTVVAGRGFSISLGSDFRDSHRFESTETKTIFHVFFRNKVGEIRTTKFSFTAEEAFLPLSAGATLERRQFRNAVHVTVNAKPGFEVSTGNGVFSEFCSIWSHEHDFVTVWIQPKEQSLWGTDNLEDVIRRIKSDFYYGTESTPAHVWIQLQMFPRAYSSIVSLETEGEGKILIPLDSYYGMLRSPPRSEERLLEHLSNLNFIPTLRIQSPHKIQGLHLNLEGNRIDRIDQDIGERQKVVFAWRTLDLISHIPTGQPRPYNTPDSWLEEYTGNPLFEIPGLQMRGLAYGLPTEIEVDVVSLSKGSSECAAGITCILYELIRYARLTNLKLRVPGNGLIPWLPSTLEHLEIEFVDGLCPDIDSFLSDLSWSNLTNLKILKINRLALPLTWTLPSLRSLEVDEMSDLSPVVSLPSLQRLVVHNESQIVPNLLVPSVRLYEGPEVYLSRRPDLRKPRWDPVRCEVV